MNDVPAERLLQIAVSGVAFGHAHGVLTYVVPDDWATDLEPGTLVWVPVQKRIELGIVVGDAEEMPDIELRSLHAPVVPQTRLTDQQMATAIWMARETVGSIYACAALFLAPGIAHRRKEMYSLDSNIDFDELSLTSSQRKVVERLRSGERVSLEALRTAIGQKLDSVLSKLVALGIV